jgi:hypothetical protein
MSGFFYENVADRVWDGNIWDGQRNYNCWRNVDRSKIRNAEIINTRLGTAADHGEGLKIDLANNCELYRVLFESNDVMHLFFSYPFWGSSLGGVSHESQSSKIVVQECGFGKGHVSQFGHAFYYHVQVHGDARPTEVLFKDCFKQEGPGWWGGPTTGFKFENLMNVPAGSDMREHMRNWANDHTDTPPAPLPPDPPPPNTLEARVLKLEGDMATAKANDAQMRSDIGIAMTKIDQLFKELRAPRDPLNAQALAAIDAEIKKFEGARQSPNIARAMRMMVDQDKAIAARTPLK